MRMVGRRMEEVKEVVLKQEQRRDSLRGVKTKELLIERE